MIGNGLKKHPGSLGFAPYWIKGVKEGAQPHVDKKRWSYSGNAALATRMLGIMPGYPCRIALRAALGLCRVNYPEMCRLSVFIF